MLGRSLSHYHVLDELGRGGMGEVYKAKDTKLGRDVAIKVLPEAFARDKERLTRFEREARLLASLNHPNIAAIYELEESDGGTEPAWAPSGKEITYRQGAKMMSVAVSTDPELSIETPKLLFEGDFVLSNWDVTNYSISPDGRRFVMIQPTEETHQTTQMVVVLNWFEELKRLVPVP